MKTFLKFNRVVLAASLGLASLGALAAPTFLGPAIDQSANGTVNPDAAPAQLKNSFQQRLLTESIKSDGFSGYAVNTPGTFTKNLALTGLGTGITMAVTGAGGEVVNAGTDPAVDGRYDTTGDAAKQWWLSAYTFTLSFTQGVSAFGFYGTDFGDFKGSFEIELLRGTSVVGGKILKEADAPSTTPMGGPPPENANNGWLQFFAFYDDSGTTYDGIRFKINQASTDPDDFDYIGFDDFVVGTLAPGGGGSTPEPGSLALVGASLLGLAAARRRRAA